MTVPRNASGPSDRLLGLCTNVLPVRSSDQLPETAHFCGRVRELAGMDTLGVSLWIPDTAAHLLSQDAGALDEIRAVCERNNLVVCAMNAFPQHDFHAEVVKHAVYRPNWATDQRARYTVECARVLTGLLPRGVRGSISTLPIGWGADCDASSVRLAARNLLRAVDNIRTLAERAERSVTLDLEPEPGCVLERSEDVCRFFDEHIPGEYREHLGVCHDVCHAAVMFEDQRAVLRRYADAGVRVHQVHVSSVPEIAVSETGTRVEAERSLQRFAEPRYLHQVGVRDHDGSFRLEEDLHPGFVLRGVHEARVHFHVPVFLESLDERSIIRTTREQIPATIEEADRLHGTGIFTVETYAWHVLPERLRREPLSVSMARELRAARSWMPRTTVAGARP